jgi:hypothetical protein
LISFTTSHPPKQSCTRVQCVCSREAQEPSKHGSQTILAKCLAGDVSCAKEATADKKKISAVTQTSAERQYQHTLRGYLEKASRSAATLRKPRASQQAITKALAYECKDCMPSFRRTRESSMMRRQSIYQLSETIGHTVRFAAKLCKRCTWQPKDAWMNVGFLLLDMLYATYESVYDAPIVNVSLAAPDELSTVLAFSCNASIWRVKNYNTHENHRICYTIMYDDILAQNTFDHRIKRSGITV